MPALHKELELIVSKASSLQDHRSRKAGSQVSEFSAADVQAKLDRWRKNVSKGKHRLFHLNLELRHISWHELEKTLLAPAPLKNRKKLPEWAQLLGDVLESRSAYRSTLPPNYAFAQVLYPFVLSGKKKLIKQSGNAFSLLSRIAVRQLENDLLKELCDISEKTFSLLFHTYAATRPESRNTQRTFIRDLRRSLLLVFKEYAVLARLLASRALLWVDSNVEFLRRLSADLCDIEETFQSGRGLDKVSQIEPSVSDFHNGRRNVAILRFQSGLKIVYKPRSVKMEKAFGYLTDWLNKQEILPELKSPQMIDRKIYGWTKYIDSVPFQKEKAHLFCQRVGMLLCIVHALRGSDLQSANVIVSGEVPVLIDAESLMSRPLNTKKLRFPDSVMQTGFLQDRRQLARSCDRSMIQGFSDMYRTFMKLRNELLRNGGPLRLFKRAPSRLILRPTTLYQKLLINLLNPAFLKNGIDRSIGLELLTRAYLKPSAHQLISYLESEIASMEQMDIPFFTTPAEFELVLQRIASMSEADLAAQIRIIKKSIGRKARYNKSARLRMI